MLEFLAGVLIGKVLFGSRTRRHRYMQCRTCGHEGYLPECGLLRVYCTHCGRRDDVIVPCH